MPDLELQGLQRSVNLLEYARSAGYQPNPRDSSPGLTMLEHPQSGDRIAVARTQHGQWIYASLTDYKPRGADEPPERARERLRDSIARTRDKGSVVECVQHCQRVAGRPEPSPEQVREHLRAWLVTERDLGHAGRVPTDALRRVPERAISPTPPNAADKAPGISQRGGNGLPRAAGLLNRRMGDWTASPVPPVLDQAEVQERLRRWQEAQRAIDLKLARATELARPPPGQTNPQRANSDGSVEKSRSPREVSRAATDALPPNPEKLALAQRRYDWTPPVGGEIAKALGLTPRTRGPERGR
jgi:hypothetical protein